MPLCKEVFAPQQEAYLGLARLRHYGRLFQRGRQFRKDRNCLCGSDSPNTSPHDYYSKKMSQNSGENVRAKISFSTTPLHHSSYQL